MTQNDFGTLDPNTKSGTALASDLNDYRDAVNSSHSGSSRPPYAVAGMVWVDTTTNPWVYYMYDGTDDIQIGTFNTSTNTFTPANAGIASLVADTTPQLGGPLDTNGQQVGWSQGSDIASATTLTVPTDGNIFDITGTTTITGINTVGVGTFVVFQFDAALTLTHHATNLILPGGTNITTAAGDHALLWEYGAGTWKVLMYWPVAAGPNNVARLDVANLWTKQQRPLSAALVFDATQDWDLAAAQDATLTLTANCTFDAPTNQVAGTYYALRLNVGAGPYSVTSWNAVFKFPSATAPTLTATASAIDILVFRSDGTNMELVGLSQDVS